ncbi:MAG: LuxR C-terminal-related transcriptional regulator [Anaerolineae bacterium]
MEAPLLATKFYVPVIRPEFVPRPRLLDRLNEGLHRKLSLVSAPAGFGKTTLLSAWAGACDRAVGWVSLSESDNDPSRFWAYVTAALEKAGVIGEQIPEAFLQSSNPSSGEALLITLLNRIAEAQTPVLLILDDYHTVTAPYIHDEVAFLLEHQPAQLHLAIATRADPPLPLALLRGRGQLTELYQRDLRFTPDETANLLNQVMGLELAPSEITALEQRTEGWIAGLQMAAVSLRGHSDRAAFVQAFSSSHRYIFDYLVEEVLRRQVPHVQRFLLRTSILDRLSGPLCDAVIWNGDRGQAGPSEDSQSLLEYLERNNLFVIPLDDDRRWYRYHHLFADLLRQRLEHEASELVPLLHKRASEWYREQGCIVDAIQHAISSGNFEHSGHLMQELGWSIFTRGELTTVLAWVAALPEEIVHARPDLCVLQAWALAKSGQLDRVEPCLQALSPDERQGEVAAVRAYVAGVKGQLPLAVELSRHASDCLPEESYGLRAIVAQNLGTAYHWRGDATAASQSLKEAVKLSQMAGQTHQSMTAMAILGRTYELQGLLQLAAETYREALDLASNPGNRPIPFAGMAYVGLAGPLYEWNDLNEAKHCAMAGIRLSELGGFVAYQVAGSARLAAIHEAQADGDSAWAMLQQADRLGLSKDYDLVRSLVNEVRVRRWIARADMTAAVRWADAHRLPAGSDIDAAREIEQMAVARVLIAEGRRAEAWDLLERLLQAVRASGRRGHEIKLLVLQALTVQAYARDARRLSLLEEALSLGEPEGYVRTFIDEGEPMGQLLRDALSQGVKPGYVARLLAALGDEERGASPVLDSLTEPLTEREMDVLHRLVAGLSNPEIAEELFIALSTVKSHVNHIYGKLGVTRRTEAVACAYELGLL